jgi:hypothetical protein
MAYMCRATYTFDVNSQTDIVEMEYTRYVPTVGWKNHIDYVETYPEGDWVDLTFSADSYVRYEDFLNTMVHKNLEVHRKIAKISLDNVSKNKLIRIMNAIKILDPTFQPPIINLECQWQVGLLKHIASHVSYGIIATCTNKKRLGRYSKVVQLL